MVSEKLLLTYLDKHHHHKQLTPFSYELPAIYKSSVITLFVNSLIHLDQRCDLVGSCIYVIQFIFLVIHLD